MSTTDWKQVGRNDPCPCGSGKKYKHCHMQIDREALQQAETEAAQKAEEERLAAWRERTEARRQEESAVVRTDVFEEEDEEEVDPELEILYEIWETFKRAEGDARWEICQSAIDDQLMDDEQVLEFFSHLHRDALERGLESRFVQLVRHLRQQCFDAYQDQISFLFELTFPLLSPSERDSFLPDLIQDLIADGPDKIELFLNVVDMLASFGESALYTEVVRATEERVKTAGLFEWAVDAYHTRYLDTYLFEYLDTTPAEEHRNPERIADLIASLPHPEDLVENEYIAYLLRLAGDRRAWTQADFPLRTSGRTDDRIPDTTVDHLVYLNQEFLAHLRWEKGIPFAKGELGTRELRLFLANQEIPSVGRRSKGKKGAKSPDKPPTAVLPLCPDREQLDKRLYSLMNFLGFQPYKGLVLMEVIPAWLQFLEERELIDAESHVASLHSLRDLAESVQVLVAHEIVSPRLTEDLAVAWATPVEE